MNNLVELGQFVELLSFFTRHLKSGKSSGSSIKIRRDLAISINENAEITLRVAKKNEKPMNLWGSGAKI
jgi:hypothetical protein